MRKNERKLNALPPVMKSNVLIAEPILLNERTDKEDPMCPWLTTEAAFPPRTTPTRLMPDAMRANDRKLKLLPMEAVHKTDIEEPNRAKLLADKLEPTSF
jgi:hypothetical protein